MAIIGFGAMWIEIKIGWHSGSSSPVADALHQGGDTATDVVVFAKTLLVAMLVSQARSIKVGAAFIQASFLTLAALLIAAELVHKIFSDREIDVLLMFEAGCVGVVGNLLRLYILRIDKGEWDINRLIQDRHTRGDLYYSLGVVAASGLIWVSGEPDWDYVSLILVLVAVSFLAKGAVQDACEEFRRRRKQD